MSQTYGLQRTPCSGIGLWTKQACEAIIHVFGEKTGFRTIKEEQYQNDFRYRELHSEPNHLSLQVENKNEHLSKYKNANENCVGNNKDNIVKDFKYSYENVTLVNGIKTYNCVDCDYSTKKRSHLLRHVKSVHQKIKDYQCTHFRIFATVSNSNWGYIVKTKFFDGEREQGWDGEIWVHIVNR